MKMWMTYMMIDRTCTFISLVSVVLLGSLQVIFVSMLSVSVLTEAQMSY